MPRMRAFAMCARPGALHPLLLFVVLASDRAVALPIEVLVESVAVAQSSVAQTVSVEVFLGGGLDQAPSVAAHQLHFRLEPAGTEMRITAAGATVRRRYLGPSLSPTSSIMNESLAVISGDVAFGETVFPFVGAGLLSVEIEVPSDAPLGAYQLQVVESSSDTFIADGESTFLPLIFRGGQLHIVIAGDYDLDNDVDGNDFIIWQRAYGYAGASNADGNLDGVVNVADYSVWREHFGVGADIAVHTSLSVPEPSGIATSCAVLFVSQLLVRRISNAKTKSMPSGGRTACRLSPEAPVGADSTTISSMIRALHKAYGKGA